MRLPQALRAAAALLALTLAACSGGSTETGALLDPNNLGGGSTAVLKVTLDCPGDALSGKTTKGFTGTVTNANGTAVPNTFLGLVATVDDDPAGSIIATKPTGGTNLGGANTNAAGKVVFAYEAPSGITKRTAATITGTATTAGGDKITGTCDLSIGANPAKLFITGPDKRPSGSITLQAGQSVRGLTATVLDSENDPIPDVTLTFTAKNDTDVTTGRVRTPQGNLTDDSGEVVFDYTAPTTVTAETDVTITATGTANGKTLTAGYLLVVQPPPPDPVAPTLTLTPKTKTVAALSTTSGFVAKLVDEDGLPVSGTTINFELTDTTGKDTGTLLTSSGGTPTRTSFVTNSSGEVPFSYKAPRATTNQSVQLDANFRFGSDVIDAQKPSGASAPVVITVTKISAPVLTAEGPNGEPTGSIEIATGSLITGFVATLVDGRGDPVINKSLSFTPSVGTVVTPNGLATDGIGQVEFDYRAPTVTSTTSVNIVVKATDVDGASPTVTYALTVTPAPPDPAPKMSMIGPSEALPNQNSQNFTLTFKREDGTSLEGARVRLSANPTANQISVVDGGVVQPGNTLGVVNAFGEVTFLVKPAAIGKDDTTFTVSAALDGSGNKAALTSQCQSDTDAVCTASKIVTVRADTFGFAAPPSYGASAPTGRDQATALNFSWMDANGTGVPGCLDLSMSAPGGSTGSKYGLIIAGDPTSPTERKRVLLNSQGNFDSTLSAYSDRSGFAEITATENRDCSDTLSANARKSTTGLQFVDVIPLREFNVTLNAQSDTMVIGTDRQLPLTFEVLNDASQPLDNQKVQFGFCQSATSPKANNEEITPGGGTTGADGKVGTTYLLPSTFEAGQPARNIVRITACIDGQFAACQDESSNVCDTFDIFLQTPTP